MTFDYPSTPPGRKTPRIRGARLNAVRQALNSGRRITKNMLPKFPSAEWCLRYLWKLGQCQRIKVGKPGCRGTPAVYQIK